MTDDHIYEDFNDNSKDNSEDNTNNNDSILNFDIPEGFGLNFDQIRMLILTKNDTSISKDDPIMMLVSILNVYLSELHKLHTFHANAAKSVLIE
ncbi:MAG: hypothetical protein LBI10_08775 [Deltaproteobacteria bacterium]|jgi:hypothetical protein|nr:hypothetical protein [Deltaproteobacteria bacterium]